MKNTIAKIHGHGVKFYSVDEASIQEAEDGSWIAYAEEIAPAHAAAKPFFNMTNGNPVGGVHLRASSRAKLVGLIRSGERECATALGKPQGQAAR